MRKVAIITDTDSNLPAAVAAQHGIVRGPISTRFSQEA